MRYLVSYAKCCNTVQGVRHQSLLVEWQGRLRERRTSRFQHKSGISDILCIILTSMALKSSSAKVKLPAVVTTTAINDLECLNDPSPKSEVEHGTKFRLNIFYSTHVWVVQWNRHQTFLLFKSLIFVGLQKCQICVENENLDWVDIKFGLIQKNSTVWLWPSLTLMKVIWRKL